MEHVTAPNLGTVSSITLNKILPNSTSFNSCRWATNEWEAGKVSIPPPKLSVRLFQKSSLIVRLMEVGEVCRSQEAGET